MQRGGSADTTWSVERDGTERASTSLQERDFAVRIFRALCCRSCVTFRTNSRQPLLEAGQFVACDDAFLAEGIEPIVDVGIVVVGAVEGFAAGGVRAVVVVPRDEEAPVLAVGPQLRHLGYAAKFADGIQLAWVFLVE